MNASANGKPERLPIGMFLVMGWVAGVAALGEAAPGMWQRALSGPFNTTDDPSVDGTLVPGALLASTHTSAYTYGGKTYSMAGNTTYAYKGVMFMKGGVTYRFVKHYDDSGLVRITDLHGTVTTVISSSSYSHKSVYGSYTPSLDGYYPIDLRVGNGSGGMGPDDSPFNQSDKLAAGLAWNTNGVETCTDENYGSWRKFMNSDDDAFLYTEDPRFAVSAAAPALLDGVHGVAWPSVVVTNSISGAELVAGRDYELVWSSPITLPGQYTVTVTGRTDSAYIGAQGVASVTACLSTDAKRPRLPAEYVESDWIASSEVRSTSQCLDSGYVPKADTRVECDCYLSSTLNNGQYECLFGSRYANSRGDSFFLFVNYGSSAKTGFGHPGEYGNGPKFPFDKRVTVIAEGSSWFATDGTTTNGTTVASTPVDCGNSMYVFNFHQASGAGDSNAAATLYAFRMTEGGKTVCWLVPCHRVSDGANGMYDVCADAFHGVIGSTAFTRGVDLVRPTVNDGELDFFATASEHDSIAFAYSVNTNALIGGEATLEWSKSPDFSEAASRSLGTAAKWGVDNELTLDGLKSSTTYYLRLTIAKAGGHSAVRTFACATTSGAGAIAADCDLKWYHNGEDPYLTCTVTTFGAGDTHTLKVLVGESEDAITTECGSSEVTESGTQDVTFRWPFYYRPAYYKVAYVTDDGTSETDVKTVTPEYSATYAWRDSVAEGDWCDAGNWTITAQDVPNPTIGYPCNIKHGATFPSGIHTATLTNDLQFSHVGFSGSAGAARLVGLKAKRYLLASMNISGANCCTVTLDNVDYQFRGSLGSGLDHVGYRDIIELQNNASLTNGSGGYPQYFDGEGAGVRIRSRSLYHLTNVSVTWVVNGGEVLVDDGSFLANWSIGLNVSGTKPSTWTFSGASPYLQATGCELTGAGGANLVFDIPRDGYANAAVVKVPSGTFLGTCAGPVTVEVPRRAKVWRGGRCASTLIAAPSGINTNRMTLVTPIRPNGSFVWETTDGVANPTALKFRLESLGTSMILR